MRRRFVIQHHVTGQGEHYDLMLERGPALATWRLERHPACLEAGQSLPATELPDHRPAYLTYEGPVSGGRGTVHIVDGGTYRLIHRAESAWQVQLEGRQVRGHFELRRLGGERWILLAGGEAGDRRGPSGGRPGSRSA